MKRVVLALLALNLVFFVAEVAIPSLQSSLALYPPQIIEAPWTFLTSMFIHAGFDHLWYNMFALALFGLILEGLIGEKRFITLYLATGLVAGIGSAIAYPASFSLGASGAIYGIIGALAVLRPKLMIYIGAPLPMLLYAVLYAFLDLVGVFTGINPDNIGYIAHLSGLAVGVILAFYWKSDYDEKKLANAEVSKELGDDELDEWEDRHMKPNKVINSYKNV